MEIGMQRLYLAILASIWLLPASPAVGSSFETRWTHFGLRPLAMGNAYVAVADDFNALFYNPAGLARIKKWDGEFLNPALEISKNFQTLINDFRDTSDEGGTFSHILGVIEKNAGEDQHVSFQWTPHLIFPNFGFGMGLQMNVSAAWHRQIAVDLDVGPDIVLPVAVAYNFLDDRLSLGASVKFRARMGLQHLLSLEDIQAIRSKKNDDDDADSNEDGPSLDDYVFAGTGIGGDIGLLFTPVKTMEPTIGISLTDIGGTSFSTPDLGGTQAPGAPNTVLPSLNLGLSLKPVQVGRMYVLTSMDMHSINQPYSYSRKLHFGSEIGYGSFLKIQAGLHQGYFTGGFQFDIGLLNLRLITYAVEAGNYAGSNENRRYAIQLKLLL